MEFFETSFLPLYKEGPVNFANRIIIKHSLSHSCFRNQPTLFIWEINLCQSATLATAPSSLRLFFHILHRLFIKIFLAGRRAEIKALAHMLAADRRLGINEHATDGVLYHPGTSPSRTLLMPGMSFRSAT